MNTTQTHLTDADRIVRKYTAMPSYLALVESMGRGYVPTVHRRRQAPLLSFLRAAGLKVFVIG